MPKPEIVEPLKEGQRVTVLVEAKGADHEDIEHTLPAGSVGIIDSIVDNALPQGVTYTVWIPVNEKEGRGIVNVFDHSDGQITDLLSPLQTPEMEA